MTRRRAALWLGCVGLVVSAAHPVGAGSGEAEGSAYAGTSAGGWVCGPAGRANYGGLGGRVVLSDREPSHERGAGWTGQIGAGAEYEHVQLNDPRCGNDCQPEDFDEPPDQVMGGGYARAGYRWRWFGMEGGVGAYQGWEHNTDEIPSLRLFPNIRLVTGPHESWTAFTGIGSEGVTTARRPAIIYAGGEFAAGGGHRVGVQGAWARQGPALDDAFGARVDLSWRIPVSPASFFRAAGSFNVDQDTADAGAEGAMGLGAVF